MGRSLIACSGKLPENPGIVPRVQRSVGKCCGRGQLPQSRACGASQLPHEGAFCRTAGVVREDKIHRPQKMFRLHESRGPRLPREGAAERLRELPSTRTRILSVATKRPSASLPHLPNHPHNLRLAPHPVHRIFGEQAARRRAGGEFQHLAVGHLGV